MIQWSHDFSAAPTRGPILAAAADGRVRASKWLPKESRWEMFTRALPPVAWAAWPSYDPESAAAFEVTKARAETADFWARKAREISRKYRNEVGT